MPARPGSPPVIRRPQPSTSSVRQARPSSTAAAANHGATIPAPDVATPAMKNTATPTSGIASAAARHADAYFSSVGGTRNTGTRALNEGMNEGIGDSIVAVAPAPDHRRLVITSSDPVSSYLWRRRT